MDRTPAFVEYGQIIDDLEDALSGGFRRPRPQQPVRPPEIPVVSDLDVADTSSGQTAAAVDVSGRGIPSVEAAQAPQAVQGSGDAGPGDAPVAPRGWPETAGPSPSAGELETIAKEISTCRSCNLYLLREHTVPGVGRAKATLMVVTQPPTDSADSLSSPLAAYEQEYLDKWLTALGLDPRGDVFVTPAVKCRTPGNRPPHPDEAAACTGFLRRQYKAVAPAAVLALGSSACGALTGNSSDFPSLVGKDWTWGATPALVLWTPAEVLANPGRLRKPVWDALQRLKASWNAVPGSQL